MILFKIRKRAVEQYQFIHSHVLFLLCATAVNFPVQLSTEMGWLWSPNAAVSAMWYIVKIDLNVTACNKRTLVPVIPVMSYSSASSMME